MFDFITKRSSRREHPREEPAAHTAEQRRALREALAREAAADAQLDGEIAEARSALRQDELLLTERRERLEGLEAARLQRSLERGLRTERLRQRLRMGLGPLVQQVLAELERLETETRAKFSVRLTDGWLDPATTRRGVVVTKNNAEDVVDTIRKVRADVQTLSESDLPADDVWSRLQALVATIPAVDDGAPIDLARLAGITPAEQRELAWRAERPRETGLPWR